MRTLFIDCSMGAAGDMLTASLLELFDDKEAIVNELNGLGIPKVKFEAEVSTKCGINGTHMKVTVDGEEEGDLHHHNDHNHDIPDHPDHHHHQHAHHHHHSDHHHSSIHDIEHVIRDHMGLCNNVTKDIMDVYSLIAEAESAAHGKPIDEIHFHEVGTMDAVADVTAVCYLIDKLKVDRIVASPVCVGSGTVKCAHGILPVPAPATAFILKGVPTYSGEIKSELCTPTGAALLKHFVSEFGSQPMMSVDRIGYGMGKKDFEVANCVRTFLGETEASKGQIIELSANIDDMTGEEVGYAMKKLFEAGALDVFTTPIGMKKNRPGILISVICSPDKKDEMVKCFFKYTSTLGIRENIMNRYMLDRSVSEVDTRYGKIRQKKALGYGVTRTKYEYDDITGLCDENNKSLEEMKEEI